MKKEFKNIYIKMLNDNNAEAEVEDNRDGTYIMHISVPSSWPYDPPDAMNIYEYILGMRE